MLAFRASRSSLKSGHKFPLIRISVQTYCIASAPFTVAPHTIPSPTKISEATSRAQQIGRHLSIATPKQINMNQLPISERGHHGNAPGAYAVRKNGAPNTLEHRIYIEKDGVPVSPFHDIPLYANEQQTILNMIVEIPRWTNAKMEVSRYLQHRLDVPLNSELTCLLRSLRRSH